MDGLEKQEVVSDKATERAGRPRVGNATDSATRGTFLVRAASGKQPPTKTGRK